MSESRKTFFRQSGWMALATLVSGACMTLVHSFVPQRLSQADYEAFGTMLRILLLLAIPSAGLQVAFAQHTASLEAGREASLATMARQILGAITAAWLLLVIAAVASQKQWVATFRLSGASILWPTLAAAWFSLVQPIFSGLVQGRQNFAVLGGVFLLTGFLRLGGVIALIVLAGGQAAAAMTAVTLGLVGGVALAAWSSRDVWAGSGGSFAWGPFLRRVVPFTLGAGCMIVLSQSDLIFLKAAIPQAASEDLDVFQMGKTFLPASTIGFAMTQFTVPLAVVMFPKIARSFARAEHSDALRLALVGTAIIGGLAALAATLLPKLPLQILYFRSPANWAASPLVPWCAWAMLAFALANVLVSDRLARADFRFVPWAMALTLAFVGTLFWLKPQIATMEPPRAYRLVVGTVGGFNLALLGIVAWVSRRPPAVQHG